MTDREKRIMALRKVAHEMLEEQGVIVRHWLQKGSVQRVFEKHGFSIDFFEPVARDIVHHFIGTLSGQEKIGSCPAMQRFIDLALEGGFGSQDIVAVCMGMEQVLCHLVIGREKGSTEAGWFIEVLGEIYERNLVAALVYYDERRLARESEEVRRRSFETQVQVKHLQEILGELESAILEINGERPVYANAAFLRLAAVPDLKTFITHHPHIWDIFKSVSLYEELFTEEGYAQWFQRCALHPEKGCEVTLFDYSQQRHVHMRLKIYPISVKEERYVAVLTDITDIWERMNTLEKMVYVDPLTRIANRRAFQQRMTTFFTRQTCDTPLRLLFVDIHNLSRINEMFDREAGDYMLKNFAKALKQRYGDRRFHARIDGDRFVVLCPDKSEKKVEKEGKALLALAESIYYAQEEHLVGNVALVTRQASDTMPSLLKRADDVLRRIRKEGGGQMMSDASLLEEWRENEREVASFLQHCHALQTSKKPLPAVVYFQEIPIESEANIGKVDEEGKKIELRLRHMAISALRVGDFLYFRNPVGTNMRATVEKITDDQVALHRLQPVPRSPLDRRNVHVRLKEPAEGIFVHGMMHLPLQVETLSLDAASFWIPYLPGLGKGDRVEIHVTLHYDGEKKNTVLVGEIIKVKKERNGRYVVVRLVGDPHALEEALQPFILFRQMEIIKTLKQQL